LFINAIRIFFLILRYPLPQFNISERTLKMKTIKFLLAGESWVSNSTHLKGWDFFSSNTYETGVEHLAEAFKGTHIHFQHMPGHLAAREFPLTLDELKPFDVLCLSDIGANTLLLHPDTWQAGKSVPNRLRLIAEWVQQGGGLLMCGGYYSFAGIYGAAKYYRSPLESVLPVNIHPFDDRLEKPEGAVPQVGSPSHPLLKGINGEWPALLGLNELVLKPEADLILKLDGHPLLAALQVNKGRSLAWASDIGPHWCPTAFAQWSGYRALWINAVNWLAHQT
jgi:uncharacterized membrane protein